MAAPTFENTENVLSWVAYPNEMMERASVMIDTQAGRYAIDPVDCTGLDSEIDRFGGLDGVAVIMDRHSRNARAIAARHDVPVFVPADAKRISAAIGGPLASLEEALEPSDFEVRWLVFNRFWEEAMLYRPTDGTLVVPETLGTASHFTTGAERIGVHPLMRIRPPRRTFRDLTLTRLFVGHGSPVLEVEDDELAMTLSAARRRLPRAWARGIAAAVTR